MLIALEESLHMAVCIQQGKSNFIEGVAVTYIVTKKHQRIFMNSVVTKFRGTFTYTERIQMHGAAPLLILLFLCLLFTLVLLLTQIPNKYIVLLWMVLSIAPIGTLLPHKFVVESDGYQIVKCARRLKFSVSQTIRELLYGMILGMRYVALGTRGVSKDNTKLICAFELVEKGDFEKALSILEKEFKSNLNNPEICNNIAWCYAELGTNLDRAINMAKKAIDLDSGEAVYHDTLGWCHYKNGDFDKAKDYVNRAIKIDPDNSILQEHKKKIETAIIKPRQS